MESPIEEIVLMCSPAMPSGFRLLNDDKFKQLSQSLPIKFIFVDDEHTKNLLIKANITQLPFMILKIGDDILHVKGTNYILKALKDLESKTTKTDPHKQLFKTQAIYKSDNLEVSFIGCDKFMSTPDDTFDLTIISEACRKVHFEQDNLVIVNSTNIVSLKKLIPLLKDKRSVLIVSKTRRLADIITGMCLFIGGENLETIQTITTIPKKNLMDIFGLKDE